MVVAMKNKYPFIRCHHHFRTQNRLHCLSNQPKTVKKKKRNKVKTCPYSLGQNVEDFLEAK